MSNIIASLSRLFPFNASKIIPTSEFSKLSAVTKFLICAKHLQIALFLLMFVELYSRVWKYDIKEMFNKKHIGFLHSLLIYVNIIMLI